jgi:glycosyltransferase involved in cell wall biosynthesis
VRILHVGKFYPPARGGMETVLASLCEGTAERWQVKAVVAHDGARTVRERMGGVEVVRVGTVARALSVSLSPGLARELWRERFDCVVLHEPNPPAGTLLAVHTPAPRLIVWHHSDIVRPAWANATYGRVQRALYRRAARVIVAAPPMARGGSVGAAARRVEVVPYGIALEPLLASAAPPDGPLAAVLATLPSPRVLFVGRLVYYKGLTVLLEAIAATGASLVIAGDGPLGPALRERAGSLGVAGRVAFCSGLSDEDVRRLYGACDVFVLPSTERTEAFGLVQVEAMASGLPVVSTDLPTGVPWVNGHEVTGLVVRRDDAGALAAALQRLLADPALRTRLGQAGRRRAIERFAVGRMIEEFAAIVESVTGVGR